MDGKVKNVVSFDDLKEVALDMAVGRMSTWKVEHFLQEKRSTLDSAVCNARCAVVYVICLFGARRNNEVRCLEMGHVERRTRITK